MLSFKIPKDIQIVLAPCFSGHVLHEFANSRKDIITRGSQQLTPLILMATNFTHVLWIMPKQNKLKKCDIMQYDVSLLLHAAIGMTVIYERNKYTIR